MYNLLLFSKKSVLFIILGGMSVYYYSQRTLQFSKIIVSTSRTKMVLYLLNAVSRIKRSNEVKTVYKDYSQRILTAHQRSVLIWLRVVMDIKLRFSVDLLISYMAPSKRSLTARRMLSYFIKRRYGI